MNKRNFVSELLHVRDGYHASSKLEMVIAILEPHVFVW
jgi:hypothetical protein